MKFAVVGGGISGLAAAWELSLAGAEVTVLEPGRTGGVIRTSDFEGRAVDEGADAFITRHPAARQLCDELGLSEQLIGPRAGRSLLMADGRLQPLPDGLVLGVPTRAAPLVRSGILSRRGKLRAMAEVVLPRTVDLDTLTVRDMVRGRFGPEVADRLVDPLVGGIYAGTTAELSMCEATPQLAEMVRAGRSILARRGRPTAPATRTVTPATGTDPGSLFLTLPAGLGQLVELLVAALERRGTVFHPVEATELAEVAGGIRIQPSDEVFDGAVVATPASVTARITGAPPGSPLRSVPVASVVLLTASLPGVELPDGVNGFLVPRAERTLMTACSFASRKWPHWADDGVALIRASAGRRGDPPVDELSDCEVTDRLLSEVEGALHRRIAPRSVRISRWPSAFPQYRVGHGAGVRAVDEDTARRLPRVRLAGSWRSGVGIPACIASGRQAAADLLEVSTAQAR